MSGFSALGNVIIIVLLVVLNGFFVAAEFGLVKVRSSRIDELISKGHQRARIAGMVVTHLHTYLSVCQLGITLTSLGLGWIGEPTIAHLIEGPLTRIGLREAVDTIAYIIAFIVVTFVHIVLGEMVPKSLAIHRAEGVVLNASPVLSVLSKVMHPFIWLLNGAANIFLKVIGMDLSEEDGEAYSEEELKILMNESHKSGLIDATEMTLLDNIFEYSDRVAREIMIPRVDMVVIPADATESDVINLVSTFEHTRYPVAEGDKDHIVGYIHVKDVYVKRCDMKNAMQCVRSIIKVPETTEIHNVLRMMQRNKTQIAVVVDEYGGTAGMVTMEDIIEELVGDIQDEFDDEPADVVQTEHGYSVDGRVLMVEVAELLNQSFDFDHVDTISGFIHLKMDKPPKLGDTVTDNGYLFTVQEAEDGRIIRVSIQRQSLQM